MKKILSILLVCISILAVGCSKDTSSEQAQANTQNQQTVSTDEEKKNENSSEIDSENTKKQNRFEMAKAVTTVFGEVKSTAGNMVTIELGEIPDDIKEKMQNQVTMPDIDGETMPDFDADDMPQFDRENMTEEDMQEMREKMKQFGGNRGSMVQGMFEDLEIELTGETKSYTIPVELSIGTSDYTSISKGMIISIGLDENDEVIRVSILKS